MCVSAIKLRSGATLLAADTYQVVSGEVHRGIALSDPGIDDSRNELLWSPQAPNLIAVEMELWGERGELLDQRSLVHGAALGGDPGRSLSAQRAALSAAHGARPGLLA